MAARRVVSKFVQNGRVAVLRMQCEDNRIAPNFLSDFHKALDEVEKVPTVKAVITTGEGKFYSNGLDVEYLLSLDVKKRLDLLSDAQKLMRRVLTFPAVTVAAMNGHSFAMGGILSISHDFRVMRSDRGWFCLPEVFLKMRFPDALVDLVRTKLPVSEHVSCFILGKKYTGGEALKAGIVDQISSSDELMTTALTLAEENTSHGKEEYDNAMLHSLKRDLYLDLYKNLNEPAVYS